MEPEERGPARLRALQSWVTPPEFALNDEHCLVGRDADCAIRVARTTVSRHHARLERRGPRVALVDLGSRNGTFVNGERLLEPRVLEDGDRLGFGERLAAVGFVDPDPTAQAATALFFNPRLSAFMVGQRQIETTPGELRLLRHLYENANQTCTREACVQAVWGEGYEPGDDDRKLDELMRRLRLKLKDAGFDPNVLIATVRLIGYTLKL